MEQKFGYNRNINNVRAKEGVTIGSSKSYVHAVKVKNMFGTLECDSMPSIVLDDECLISKDLSKALLGRVKEFASLPNLKIVLKNEGFAEIKIQYMGEFWVLLDFPSIIWVEIEGVPFKLWYNNTFKRIAAKWGELLDVDDQEEEGFHSKRSCIYSKSGTNIYENFKVIFRGNVFLIRAKEVPGWVPKFVDDSDDDDETDNGFKDGDAKVQEGGSCEDDSNEVEVPETMFEKSLEQKENQSKDPFGIYFLLNKNKDKSKNMKPSDHSLKYPPSFTPNGDNNEFCMHEENVRIVKLLTSERFGLVFNVQGANVFNAFIANAGLEEVPVGGSSFTWCHKSATKMSKLDRFDKPTDNRVHIDMNFPKSITINQQMDLECAISKEELKRAVWECDAPFILNEVIQWCKLKKKQSLIFKVNFEKAYDSVLWDFLDDVLKKFGFGNKWCAWIQSCLRSSRGSIIINGSPTEEFQFFKGLKQGTKVGGNMSRVQAWTEVVDKVKSRLSNWKMKSLSIGETEKEVTVNSKMSDTRWVWSLEGSGEFSVASIRKIIDDNRLSIVDTRTIWIKYVPIKVNVLSWKIKIEALPTRFNISRRCIDIDSILCPI
nr:glucose-methanol-choline oxidoreductase, FAD/NAD(P)-binding domain protein [Tanacetum cinerariifolium]